MTKSNKILTNVDKYNYSIKIRKTTNAVVGATSKIVNWDSFLQLPDRMLKLFRNLSKKSVEMAKCMPV